MEYLTKNTLSADYHCDLTGAKNTADVQVVVYTLGCKTNQYEGETLVKEFIKRGVSASDKMQVAQVYVINTCSVTCEADRKSRQFCRRASSLNPSAKIYVCGCSVKFGESNFAGATIIAGATQKEKIVDIVLKNHNLQSVLKDSKIVKDCVQVSNSSLRMARKYIKIQDGCDEFCKFCIIPYLRGRSKSRNIEEIVAEISDTKAHEIILTGINVTAFGKDNGTSLLQLVSKIDTTARIRLSSLGCSVIDEPLLKVMLDKNFCNHFHLSLQSGSNNVLSAMNRKYTTYQFASKVDMIRRIFGDNTCISTDIIVGYPTEQDCDHRETLQFAQQIGFGDAHLFKYSSRPHTAAAKLKPLPSNVVDGRFGELNQVVQKSKTKFLQGQINLTHQVCFENTNNGGVPQGFTRNYCKVESKYATKNSLQEVKILGIQGDILQCEII
jgi:threonylcarbamoyladenosine tRNA methylthiotransferase MtaB